MYRRRLSTTISSVVTVALALSSLVFAVSWAAAQATGTVVVAAKTSLVRLQPSIEARAILKAESGAEFTVTGSSSG